MESRQQWNLFWSMPKQRCQVYALCGAFSSCNNNNSGACDCLTGFQPTSEKNWNKQDYYEGCVRKTRLQCDNASAGIGNGDQFLQSRYSTFPEQNNMVFSGVGCESACLEFRSCTANGFENNRCSIWIGDLLNLQLLGQDDNTTGKTLSIRLEASEFPNEISPPNKKSVIVAVAIAVSAGLLLLGLIIFTIMKARRRTSISTEPASDSLIIFGYRDLEKATKNFSEKLGKGGFGSVFKGTLPDGSIIAVKKLESINQREKQFRVEIGTIGKINHVNLVRLRGFCSEGSRELLAYDFMPKASLDRHLFLAKDSEPLDWKTRYQIALGAARGLAYLHENCVDSIIHCDIKPENILLDVDNCPKLADFGLAKLVGREFSRVLTTTRGTVGYLAPEWISGVAITPKADVFSFGMMLLELVSGRRNFEHTSDEEGTFFPVWVARQLTKGNDLLKLLDSRLNGNADLEELCRICKIACWCIQDHEIQRPSMVQVVQVLEDILDVSLPPIPRFLQDISNEEDHIFMFTDATISVT
ncbi:G-type lectin S-receptor-like serine/threonine-protein kinase [Hibiscus syriacus]|uniref:G-type lectin S-receptor-like serine/threonine-protein kinase n=1 Tax=Hibiscus syriacus TaxID=106335 RepID=A0A6A2XTC8_HIBSY|nr:G-type lectin S-receptor-like serine/threonine-protein kinase [Hibiscus syriacus]